MLETTAASTPAGIEPAVAEKRRRFVPLACGLLLAAACGGSGGTTGGGNPGTNRTVVVSTLVTGWLENGTSQTAPDPGFASVVLRQTDSHGIATDTPAASDAAGHWTASLAAGSFWVVATSTAGIRRHVEVSSGASQVDLGQDTFGPLAPGPIASPTPFTINLAGLDPWVSATDQLQLFDFHAGLWWTTLGMGVTPAVNDGATSGSYGDDWGYIGASYLLQTADSLWVTQLRAFPTNTTDTYNQVVAAQELTGLSMSAGVPLTVSATSMLKPTGVGSVAVDLRASQLASALQAGGTSTAVYVTVFALPAPRNIGASIDLLELLPSNLADHDYGTISYNRFLPTRYHEMLDVSAATRLVRSVPGGGSATKTFFSSVRADYPIGQAPSSIVPLVGVPANVRLNGTDSLAAPLTGVTTTPVLAWSPPAVGQADGYVVQLFEFHATGATTAATTLVGSAYLDSTSWAFPSGLLQVGTSYVVRLTAVHDQAAVGGASPFRSSPLSGKASLWTQTFSP